MKFVKNNSSKFTNTSLIHPFTCSFMKFISGMFTEIMSIIMIMNSNDISEVVKDFIAFNIIKEIDNMMVMTISSVDI